MERPDELDMADPAHVAWVRTQRDPRLWHEAAMAAQAYRGDDGEFLEWLIEQPELDRGTAGWMFLWPEGSLYLRGQHDLPLDTMSSRRLLGLFAALCARSETMGFTNDAIGIDPGFEEERRKCIDIMAAGVAPDVVAPRVLLDRPFARPHNANPGYYLDDGIIVFED